MKAVFGMRMLLCSLLLCAGCAQTGDGLGYKKTTDTIAQLGVLLAYAKHEDTSDTLGKPANSGMKLGGVGPGTPGGSTHGASSGLSPSTSAQRIYTNQLVVVIVDLKKSSNAGPAVELWGGETINTSHSNNFMQVAPLMGDAALRHFGETIPSKVRHQFSEEETKKLQKTKEK